MPSPSLSERVPRSKTRQRKRESSQSQKCIKAQSLMRARQHAPGEVADNLYAHTPVLELVTPLESLCVGWDAAEVQAGRRLVRFHKIQDGCRVILSCEAIKQHEYDEADSVVSCIYRAEAEGCVVTSVDIICPIGAAHQRQLSCGGKESNSSQSRGSAANHSLEA
ncbi:hypothetical protein C8J57DRAFT_593908 [Mycena rebaudengoi]|nr:hypothetical protein C8J57DRAFT_593908 [Mycena rebaudengoi]